MAMTIQIAVRLPDDQVAFIDRQVSEGVAKSRAALVSRAVRRLEREEQAARDLKDIISRGGDAYPELAGVAKTASTTPLDLD